MSSAPSSSPLRTRFKKRSSSSSNSERRISDLHSEEVSTLRSDVFGDKEDDSHHEYKSEEEHQEKESKLDNTLHGGLLYKKDEGEYKHGKPQNCEWNYYSKKAMPKRRSKSDSLNSNDRRFLQLNYDINPNPDFIQHSSTSTHQDE